MMAYPVGDFSVSLIAWSGGKALGAPGRTPLGPRAAWISEHPSPLQGIRQHLTVSELEGRPGRQASRQAGDAHTKRAQQTRKIEGRAVAFECRAGAHDHLLDASGTHALHEPIDRQMLWTDIIQWR